MTLWHLFMLYCLPSMLWLAVVLVGDTVAGTGVTAGTTITAQAFNSTPDITIRCGQGSVTISGKDGKVTFDRCEPDDAAKRFWDAVTRTFPGNR